MLWRYLPSTWLAMAGRAYNYLEAAHWPIATDHNNLGHYRPPIISVRAVAANGYFEENSLSIQRTKNRYYIF